MTALHMIKYSLFHIYYLCERNESMVKFDMHCHTAEGSLDASISVFEYAKKLSALGYRGLLTTDHNSYEGHHKWLEATGKYPPRKIFHPLLNHKQKGLRKRCSGCLQMPCSHHSLPKNFVVLKGIEYDTIDAGHILVIMPHNIHLGILELRGLPVEWLIHIVHRHGGVLGPAHPYGEKVLSFATTVPKIRQKRLLKKFDFIETFNACESEERNEKARYLALRYGKPGIGGSDAHRIDCLGYGYTNLPDSIRDEDDFIRFIRNSNRILSGGKRYNRTTKDKIGKWNHLLILLFLFYNKATSFLRFFRRKKEFEQLKNKPAPKK